jgi:hypothetical protein
MEINVNLSFEIKVTAEEARRKVDTWLLNEVSYIIGADRPRLIVGEGVRWRVPAWISFPNAGRFEVGTVDVDVETGEMIDLSGSKAEIERCAQETASRLPPSIPKGQVRPEYLAKDVPPAPEPKFVTFDSEQARLDTSEA